VPREIGGQGAGAVGGRLALKVLELLGAEQAAEVGKLGVIK